jgi:ribosomal protein S20
MPNKKAAIKDLRQSKKRHVHNLRIKTNVRQSFKQAQELLKAGKLEEAKPIIKKFQKAADKATKGKVISRNKARRKTSRLMKAVNPKKTKSE